MMFIFHKKDGSSEFPSFSSRNYSGPKWGRKVHRMLYISRVEIFKWVYYEIVMEMVVLLLHGITDPLTSHALVAVYGVGGGAGGPDSVYPPSP